MSFSGFFWLYSLMYNIEQDWDCVSKHEYMLLYC